MPAKLGIIAGKGSLPSTIINTCIANERPFHVLAIEGAADSALLTSHPHSWFRIGAIGTALDILKKEAVKELVMAGRVERPALSQLRPDLTATKLLTKLGSSLLKGDDTLLRGIIDFLEKEGFSIVGAHEVVSSLLANDGIMGKHAPAKKLTQDIEYGARIAHEIGRLDIGQSVIVHNEQVIGVEGIEGTDALIQRCGLLKTEEGGILVKLCKPQQDTRVDLPTIGLQTVKNAADAALAGIVVETGHTLILDREAVIAEADKCGLFVLGYTAS